MGSGLEGECFRVRKRMVHSKKENGSVIGRDWFRERN